MAMESVRSEQAQKEASSSISEFKSKSTDVTLGNYKKKKNESDL